MMNENNAALSVDAAANVWPPPPANVPTAPAQAMAYGPFTPLRSLATVFTGLLAAYCLCCLVQLSGQALPLHNLVASAGLLLQVAIFLTAGIVFLMWVFRINKNALTFGATDLTYSPGWAVGYYLVPIFSLLRPFQAIQEVWQASDPCLATRNRQAWQQIRVPALLTAWWGCWIGSWLLRRVNNDVGDVVVIFAAVFAIQVVRRLTARQEETARALSLLA